MTTEQRNAKIDWLMSRPYALTKPERKLLKRLLVEARQSPSQA